VLPVLCFLFRVQLVRMYRVYCQPCQQQHHLVNVAMAQGSRRKRNNKHEGFGLASPNSWSPAGRHIPDAAVSLHCNGLDDTERLEREEDDQEKQLQFLYQPEKHQGVVLIEEDGSEVKLPSPLKRKREIKGETMGNTTCRLGCCRTVSHSHLSMLAFFAVPFLVISSSLFFLLFQCFLLTRTSWLFWWIPIRGAGSASSFIDWVPTG
jgi:hypothetical protein